MQVRDVARIEDGMAEAQTVASVNGNPTVLMQVRKQSGTNTVEMVNAVKARLMDVERTLPASYRLRIVRDQAEFIEASITSVQEHLVVGSILAALVVLLFLGNLRSTVIAAIAIPRRSSQRPVHLVHGLYAQHADDARVDVIGRHRHR